MAGITATDDLRMLSEARVAEARTLLDATQYSGAYYLAGYGVELGLKAVLTQDLVSHQLPDKREVADVHTHDLLTLAKKAGLEPEADAGIRVAWQIVVNWSPESRYRDCTPRPALRRWSIVHRRWSHG
jgi:HEPN domain-containing protein